MITANAPTFLFETAQGVPMTVAVYAAGEAIHTGRDRHYINTAGQAVAAFYDRRYCDPPFHPEYGQFIADYYVSDLRGHAPTAGLRLQGDVDAWTIDAATMQDVVAFLERVR